VNLNRKLAKQCRWQIEVAHSLLGSSKLSVPTIVNTQPQNTKTVRHIPEYPLVSEPSRHFKFAPTWPDGSRCHRPAAGLRLLNWSSQNLGTVSSNGFYLFTDILHEYNTAHRRVLTMGPPFSQVDFTTRWT